MWLEPWFNVAYSKSARHSAFSSAWTFAFRHRCCNPAFSSSFWSSYSVSTNLNIWTAESKVLLSDKVEKILAMTFFPIALAFAIVRRGHWLSNYANEYELHYSGVRKINRQLFQIGRGSIAERALGLTMSQEMFPHIQSFLMTLSPSAWCSAIYWMVAAHGT